MEEHNCTVSLLAVAGKRYNNPLHLLQKRVSLNMIVSDWPIIIIGPGGYMVMVQKFIGNKNDVQIRVCGEHPKIDVVFTHNNNF